MVHGSSSSPGMMWRRMPGRCWGLPTRRCSDRKSSHCKRVRSRLESSRLRDKRSTLYWDDYKRTVRFRAGLLTPTGTLAEGATQMGEHSSSVYKMERMARNWNVLTNLDGKLLFQN